MKNFVNVICVVAALALVAVPRAEKYGIKLPDWANFNKPDVVEVVKPAELYGFDKSIPAALKDKVLAAKLTGLCNGMADVLEQDGSKTDPAIKFVANINDLRLEALNIALDGKRVNEVAPQFGPAVAAVFQKEFPDGTVELDNTLRKKAVELFRALSYGCSLVK